MTEEKDLIVKEHDYYFTPSDYLAQRYLYKTGLDVNNTKFLQEMARFYYYQMVEDPNYIKDEYAAGEFPEDFNPGNFAQKSQFFEKLFPEYMPGMSPIEKASNALYLLSLQTGKKDNLEEQLSEKTVDAMREMLPDKEMFESKDWDKLLNTRGLNEFTNKIKYLNKVGIVEGFGKTFEIKKTVEHKKVHNSDRFKMMRISEYSEIVKSPIYQRIFPNYRAKLLAKDIAINSPISSQESKQKIIVLVDFSGSMNSHFKQDWVLTILADRLYHAMKEECEIFFSFFVEKLIGKFHHIYNEKTALEFFKSISTSPNGGDTYIGDIINTIKKEVEDNKQLFNIPVDLSKEKPEMLIINDGEDSCKVSNFSWKANAITLGRRNPELKDLVEKSGGRYITIDQNGKLGT
jgi:uncharacterized protein with von Willebrand factor type A (vWA) domain